MSQAEEHKSRVSALKVQLSQSVSQAAQDAKGASLACPPRVRPACGAHDSHAHDSHGGAGPILGGSGTPLARPADPGQGWQGPLSRHLWCFAYLWSPVPAAVALLLSLCSLPLSICCLFLFFLFGLSFVSSQSFLLPFDAVSQSKTSPLVVCCFEVEACNHIKSQITFIQV